MEYFLFLLLMVSQYTDWRSTTDNLMHGGIEYHPIVAFFIRLSPNRWGLYKAGFIGVLGLIIVFLLDGAKADVVLTLFIAPFAYITYRNRQELKKLKVKSHTS